MKKKVFVFLLAAVLAFSFGCVANTANGISVIVDGNTLSFDVPPVVENGRTLVPLRAIFEALDADVKWSGENQTILATRAETQITLKIGDTIAYINSKPAQLEVPAKVIQGRTLVPLRFVGESLGAQVVWEDSTRRITITSGGTNSKDMSVHFINVGQGDAILIQAPNGKVMLIDGGPRSAGEKVVSYLKKASVSSIDILVATHPHEDHIGGLIDVLNTFTVKEIYDSGYPHTSKTYENYLTLIEEKDINFSKAHAFNQINIDPAISVTILHPSTTMEGINNNSVVLKVQYDNVGFMFTGDAEGEAEANFMERTDDATLISTILKVSHHGSYTSTSRQFLHKVAPKVAIISVGAGNDYGHPHSDILQRIKSTGAKIYRTDLNGDIVISTDGNTYQVETNKSSNPVPALSPVPAPQPEPQPAPGNASSIKITNIDLSAETVTIINTGSNPVNMTSWQLESVKGNQTFEFPAYTLQPGAQVIISSGENAVNSPPTHLKWTGDYIWNNDGDHGILYDNAGNVVSSYE